MARPRWHVYNRVTHQRIGGFAGEVAAARVKMLLAERPGWLRIYHDGTGEDWQRKGGRWEQLAPDELARPA